MLRAGVALRMSGYTIFDTVIGRCGIAWGDLGVSGVHLPEAREIETRRRLFQLFPDARELRPSEEIRIAIESIAALLQGKPAELSGVPLDLTGIPAFNARVYEFTRGIPRGETRSRAEIAVSLK